MIYKREWGFMCPGSEELDLACELAMIARNIFELS
jgi:hypothetical protein